MNIQPFLDAFEITAVNGGGVEARCNSGNADVDELITAFGGRTFSNGLYRLFAVDQLADAMEAMERVFPEYRGRIVPFAFDWLGRHFAVDRARTDKGMPHLLMLEVGAGEAMVIPASLEDFHNVELVEFANDALALPFWKSWREANPNDLRHSDCVGYTVPLFLGGVDEITNLEVVDLSVYVELCAQLRP